MKITAEESGGKLTLCLSGELDHHEAKELNKDITMKLETITPRDCILDMTGVTFMDSSGIAIILKAYKRMRDLGGRLWVENVPEQPMRVLSAAGIERLVRISALP